MAIVDCSVSPEALTALIGAGVDFLQLRDHAANGRTLLAAAHRIADTLQGTETRLLINSRADVALTTQAHGVHLRSHAQTLTPAHIRTLFAAHGRPEPVVSVSCHTLSDIQRAQTQGASMALFGPVFEKHLSGAQTVPGVGLDLLAEACHIANGMPVLALGGVNNSNTPHCLQAGAAGIAAIRLFA